MNSAANELTTETDNKLTAKKYKWRGNKKQRLFIQYWLEPNSQTFGNAYKSALKAGFSNTYSLNLTGQAPKWLSENLERVDFTAEHIKQGLQQLAISAPDSRSPDDTRLKSLEILSKIHGLIDNKNGTQVNVNVVQPILNGNSTNSLNNSVNKHSKPTREVIDL